MASATLDEPTRGDFLEIATGATCSALWPLINQMNPDASSLVAAKTGIEAARAAPLSDWRDNERLARSGRIPQAPAAYNLPVPDYKFSSATKITIG